MTRTIAIVGAVLLVVLTIIVIVAIIPGSEEYRVRAIFNNASFVVKHEDVRVAGVNVGSVESVSVTADNRAAVVLKIDDDAYKDFRRDAHCLIRPQSLLGERYVECEPTEPRSASDRRQSPPLRKIEVGPGEGQYLLPVSQNGTSVDIDLVANTFRRPYAERFSIILNELGTALAGRGDDLNEVIRNAHPALRELDKVLVLLANQRRALAELATDSATVLGPLARERRHLTGFFEHGADVAEATVERRTALQAALHRFPGFLRELRPTLRDLGSLEDATTPVLSDLGSAAPDLNSAIQGLPAFSRTAIPAFVTLGQTADVGAEALSAARPTIQTLARSTSSTRKVADSLAPLLSSFRRTGGIGYLMDLLFYQAGAINGFDNQGHYLRANQLVNTCSTYVVEPQQECLATFPRQPAPEADANAAAGKATQQTRAHDSKSPRVHSKSGRSAPKLNETDKALLEYLFGGEAK